jgi:hypothetical protein
MERARSTSRRKLILGTAVDVVAVVLGAPIGGYVMRDAALNGSFLISQRRWTALGDQAE